MRGEALPEVGGWESAISLPCRAGSQAKGFGEIEVDNVSFITIAKSEGNAVVNYGYLGADYARCSRYALKKLPRSVFFFIFSLLQLHYHFAVIYVMLHTSSFVETTSSSNAHFHIKDPRLKQ